MSPVTRKRPHSEAATAQPAAAGIPLTRLAGEPSDLPGDAVEVARVVGAWGIKGAIKLKAFAAEPQALFSSKRWYLVPGERLLAAGSAGAASVRLLRVTQAREHGEAIIATIEDLNDRDGAQALAGSTIHVPRSSFPTPDADEFYWVDLIGLEVFNRAGDRLGAVESLIETGPHCVLCLAPAAADRPGLMIPFVDAYVDAVDREARVIRVDWQPDY